MTNYGGWEVWIYLPHTNCIVKLSTSSDQYKDTEGAPRVQKIRVPDLNSPSQTLYEIRI
jgi:hypothetical protein